MISQRELSIERFVSFKIVGKFVGGGGEYLLSITKHMLGALTCLLAHSFFYQLFDYKCI